MDGGSLADAGMRPVPYEDELYAEYELDRCRQDQNSFDQTLTIISIIAASTVFFQRIRNKEHRKFPDNILTMSLISLCGIHLALLLSIASQNRVVLVDEQPWRGLCQIQGRMFHWCSCAAIWNVVCVILTLHRVIVRKIPVADLLRYSRAYYLTLVGLPSLAVTACSIFGGYGPYPGLHNCWIDPGAGRLVYFHSFTAVAFVTFLVLGPPTVLALWRAYHSAAQPSNAGLFRALMWRQVLLAIYGLAVVSAFLLGGLNNIIIKSHAQSSYVKKTAYPICIFSAVNFASLGLSVSIIYWSTRSPSTTLKDTAKKVATYACCSRVRDEEDNETYQERASEDGIDMVCTYEKGTVTTSKPASGEVPPVFSTHSLPPSSPDVREDDLRSAFDSGGQSVTSIPPDPKHRAAHFIASNAYTSTLLEYVREQLLEEEAEDDDSDFSSMYDDESIGRSSMASEMSLDDLAYHRESSFPSSPMSNFHEISPRHIPTDTHSVLIPESADNQHAHRDQDTRKRAVTEL